MEIIRSRQNETVRRFVALGRDAALRRETGEFLCAGESMLQEAADSGADITCVLALERRDGLPCRVVTAEILRAVSPLQNSSEPVFTVKMPPAPPLTAPRRALVLENVQDPGNVGTVLRTADAFGVDLVVLCGACADLYNPKTVRATMGAIFRQRAVRADITALPALLGELPLFGAAPRRFSADVRALPAGPLAVAVGNEGQGLSRALLALCAGTVTIPMRPRAESLNAAVAAAVLMWEMVRGDDFGAAERGEESTWRE